MSNHAAQPENSERGPEGEIFHTHPPDQINVECPGCCLTHFEEGPDLIFRWDTKELRMTQVEWFRSQQWGFQSAE